MTWVLSRSQVTQEGLRLVRRAGSVSLTLFRVMIPIIVAVKLVKELGWIPYLARPLAPVMEWVGLPPEMGLVWATAMVNNIYGAIIVFASLVGEHPLTAAQATVLGVMILVAHGLPVELRIAQVSGPKLWFQLLLRVGGAILLGLLLGTAYSALDLHTEPAAMLWTPAAGETPGLLAWLRGEALNLAMIYLIILGLLLFLRILEAVRAIRLMNRILGPALRLIGIGPRASSLAIIGLTMGISYGGGLIIDEARSGNLPQRDVFHSLSLLGLCHSLFEDSLLLVVIGGQLSGLLWGRLMFALVVIAVLVRITNGLSTTTFDRLFWRSACAHRAL